MAEEIKSHELVFPVPPHTVKFGFASGRVFEAKLIARESVISVIKPDESSEGPEDIKVLDFLGGVPFRADLEPCKVVLLAPLNTRPSLAYSRVNVPASDVDDVVVTSSTGRQIPAKLSYGPNFGLSLR